MKLVTNFTISKTNSISYVAVAITNFCFTTINKTNSISYVPVTKTNFCCTTIIKTNTANWLRISFCDTVIILKLILSVMLQWQKRIMFYCYKLN